MNISVFKLIITGKVAWEDPLATVEEEAYREWDTYVQTHTCTYTEQERKKDRQKDREKARQIETERERERVTLWRTQRDTQTHRIKVTSSVKLMHRYHGHGTKDSHCMYERDLVLESSMASRMHAIMLDRKSCTYIWTYVGPTCVCMDSCRYTGMHVNCLPTQVPILRTYYL